MSQRVNILLVEDELLVAEHMKILLESFMECDVYISNNSAEAVEYAQNNSLDLIFMDIVLKGRVDGIQTAHLIRKTLDVPIIYMTAHDDEQFLDRAKITDPFGYMLKPVQLRELQATVSIALQQHKNKLLLQREAYVTQSLKKLYHPLIVTDKNGKVTSINDAAQKLLSMREKYAASVHCDTLLHVLLRDKKMLIDEEIEKASHNDGLYKEEENVNMKLPSGGIIPISITFSLIRDDMNELNGVCIMIVDLTQQTVEKNLLHEKQLEAAELLIREKKLKEILDIGKDINQTLIYPTPINERLDFVVNRIVQFSNFKIAHIALEDNLKLITTVSSRNSLLYIKHHDEIPKSDSFSERMYKCKESGKIDIWDKSEGVLPSLFNERSKNIPLNSILMLPLRSIQSEETLGVLNIVSSDENAFDIDTINYFEEFANDIALAITLQKHRDEIEMLKFNKEENYEQTILAFVQMIEERDIYTRGHSERVAKYAKAIAHEMGYDSETCTKIYRAAILHDIGKIQTPDKILLKPDNLDKDEYSLVKEHSEAGVRMLKPIEMYANILDMIAQHHERHNGKGYPKGLKGDEIDSLARIMSVADAFDAMTTNRIYRKRLSKLEAMEELKKESAEQFHPDVVNAALKILPSFTIPEVSQIASSPVERERMAYYFKDVHTHLYNEEYLQYYIHYFPQKILKQHVCICRISGLEKYNEEHSWCDGSKKIKELANAIFLLNDKKEALCFRVHGNRFLILSDEIIDKQALESMFKTLLKDTQLITKLEVYDAQSILKDASSESFEKIIHQLVC